MEDDDEETERLGIADSAWSSQSQESYNSAVQHFNLFLRAELRHNPVYKNGKTTSMQLFGTATTTLEVIDDVDYREWCRNRRHKLISHIDYNIINGFGRYLVQEATYIRSEGSQLSAESVSRYFSSMKTHIVQRALPGSGYTAGFTNEEYISVRNGMMKEKKEIDDAMGPNSNQTIKTTVKRIEMARIVVVSIWSMDWALASLSFFLVSLYQFAARGRECARLKLGAISMEVPAEFQQLHNYVHIPNVFVKRSKNAQNQNLSIFNENFDHEGRFFILDWSWLFGYTMILDPAPSDHLFRNFANTNFGAEELATTRAARMSVLQQQTRDVSKRFKQGIDTTIKNAAGFQGQLDDHQHSLASLWSKLTDQDVSGIDKKRRAHDAKRGSVNVMNDSGLKPSWTCDRAGWEMKKVHTIFDYLDVNAANDRKAGKTLSNWTHAPQAGQPPLLSSIEQAGLASGEEMVRFRNLLFAKLRSGAPNIDWHHGQYLQLLDLLSATLLMHLLRFTDLMMEHPAGIMETAEDCFNDSLYLGTIRSACSQAIQSRTNFEDINVLEVLAGWSKAVEHDYVIRNAAFVGMKLVQNAAGPDYQFEFDYRSIEGLLKDVAHGHIQSTSAIHHCRTSTTEIARQLQTQWHEHRANMEHRISGLETSVKQLLQAIGQPTAQQQDANVTTQQLLCPAQPTVFSPPTPNSISGVTPSQAFVEWYATGMFKKPGKNTKKEDRVARNHRKPTVEFFSLFVDEQIPHITEGMTVGDGSQDAEAWENTMRNVAKTAWEKITVLWKAREGQNGIPKYSTAMTTFVSFMKGIPINDWPDNAVDNGNFTNQNDPGCVVDTLRNREQLVMARTSPKKTRKRKNADETTAVPTELA